MSRAVSVLVAQGVVLGACGRHPPIDAVLPDGSAVSSAAARPRASASATVGDEGPPTEASAAPVASAAPLASVAPAEASKATAVIPEAALKRVLGCWLVPDSGEVWSIQRAGPHGASVVRTLSKGAASLRADDARRAARPTELLYSESDGSYGFTSAGHIHALLFVFSVTPQGLLASGNTSFVSGDGYPMRGVGFPVRRC